MKNRASAERSRQRKQAYVEELEMKMAAVISEKMILQVPLPIRPHLSLGLFVRPALCCSQPLQSST
jgi:hypothetical protein